MKKAFTLVELLVVMAIIGVLAAMAVGSFRTAQLRGRDAQRKSDLKQISHSLELFYADYGRYPNNTVDGKIVGCPYTTDGITPKDPNCTWGTGNFTDGKTVYFRVLPDDPSTNSDYFYELVGTNNQKYRIFANLENTEDQDCVAGDCSTSPYNFAVTSANTTWDEALRSD